MSQPISPVLDTLVAEIDRQIDSCPNPFDAENGNSLFEAALGKSRRRGRQYICFFLDDTQFALPLANALQIGYTPEVTPLPNLPRWILGICNIRGEIVSIVNLKDILKMEHQGCGATANFIILQNNKIITAIMTDRIAGILFDGDQDNIIMKREYKEEKLSDYVHKIFVCGKQVIHLLNVDRLFSSIQLGDGLNHGIELVS